MYCHAPAMKAGMLVCDSESITLISNNKQQRSNGVYDKCTCFGSFEVGRSGSWLDKVWYSVEPEVSCSVTVEVR